MGLPYQAGMCLCNVTFLHEPEGWQPCGRVILGNHHCKWMLCLLLQVKLVVEPCFSFIFAPVNEQSQWAGPGGGCGEGVLVVLMGQSREHQKLIVGQAQSTADTLSYPRLRFHSQA